MGDDEQREGISGEFKTLELNLGKIYFKWTPYRIEFDVKEETVIERLRAPKIESSFARSRRSTNKRSKPAMTTF